MARTFILGSGFSASFGLPTTAGLFEKILTHGERERGDDVSVVHNAVAWFQPGFGVLAADPNYPPFERFLSLVDAARELPSFEVGYWEPVWKGALRLLTDYLQSLLPDAERHSLLRAFVHELCPGDVVVTFNWDNLVERALARCGNRFVLGCRDRGAVSVLKLHGSVNWVRPPDGISPVHKELYAEVGERVYMTRDLSMVNPWDPLDMPPLIVPPSARKAPLADPFLKPQWFEAALGIREADKVVVIGYSMPDEDLQAQALLSTSFRALSRPYYLVDPDPKGVVAKKYRERITASVLPRATEFDASVVDELVRLESPTGARRGVVSY